MRGCLALVFVVACGSSKPSPPPSAPVVPPPPPPAVANCTDVGVILRGEISSEGEVGPTKEKAIAKACEDDRWPQAVIDCVASTPQPQDCLDKLDAQRRTAYDERLQAWSDEHGEGDGVYGGLVGTAPPILCDDLIGNGTAYYPPAKERTWAQPRRREALVEACEHDWSEPLKTCLEGAAADEKQIDACFKQELTTDEIDELVKELTALDLLADKIELAKKKPATITCKKVVDAHYGDAAWKQKLDGYKPAERKRMIAASRDQMTKACTADKWDDTLRACLVAGGQSTCLGVLDKRRWGFPAAGTVTSVGIAECDEYSATVMKFVACDKLPQNARDSIVRSQQQMLAEIASLPAAERAKMATSCKAGMDAITTSLSAAGC